MVKIQLKIHYNTRYGQQLLVTGNSEVLGDFSVHSALEMQYDKDGYWMISFHVALSSFLQYRYIVKNEDGSFEEEIGIRRIETSKYKQINIEDTWRSSSNPDNPFLSSAFTKAIFKRSNAGIKTIRLQKIALRIGTRAPKLPLSYTLGILGSIPELGNWDIRKSVPLNDLGNAIWAYQLTPNKNRFSIDYKYVLLDAETKKFIVYEDGDNRNVFFKGESGLQIKADEDIRFNTHWKGAGIALPVFSIRTKNGLGVGEFNDLKQLGHWANCCKLNLIQILPINDTTSKYTWKDSYPYNAISTNALHPLYLNIELLYDKVPSDVKKFLNEAKKQLNALQFVDYEKVIRTKFSFAKNAYELAITDGFFESEDYRNFENKNAFWLISYAAFSYFRDKFNTSNFREWDECAKYDKDKIEDYFAQNTTAKKEMQFYLYLQFHLAKQLGDAVDYVRSKNIALKGDIPIGINPCSVEAWTDPHLFNFNMQTGAPPDDFAIEGQNWGFPTYNWTEMEKDGYEWWQNRFKQLAKYFDAYRIDHILGFFRIWQIPFPHKSGLMGHFSPAIPFSKEEIASYGCSLNIDDFTEPCEDENMLFLKSDEEGKVHPKISMLKSPVFSTLSYWNQEALIRLYNNYFYERHDAFWRQEALKKLRPILKATEMLCCGEDLGMIPNCVESVMDELQILSLEVQRMPKGFGQQFGLTNEYPYMSVATPSSHDTSTLRGWWEEDFEATQKYFNEILWQYGETPKELTPELARIIVNNHLQSPSMLTIIPLQDFLAMDKDLRFTGDVNDERVNVPANPDNYWRYRLHLNIEDLIKAEGFSKSISQMVKYSGR